LDVTVYKSNTKNQIVPISISTASGYTTKIVNAGNIENKGIEIALQATPVQLRNGLRWDISFNYARNYSKVIELAPGIETFFLNETSQVAQIEARTGERFGNIVGYRYRRAPDGQIIVNDDGSYAREDTLSILGNVTPKWTGGLNNTFSYKGFSLNFLIDYRSITILCSGPVTSARFSARNTISFLSFSSATSTVAETSFHAPSGNSFIW